MRERTTADAAPAVPCEWGFTVVSGGGGAGKVVSWSTAKIIPVVVAPVVGAVA
jgi:hypothetical protein